MGNITAPRFKPIECKSYFFLNVTFNNPFVLNALNVANRYIFKCERASKVE